MKNLSWGRYPKVSEQRCLPLALYLEDKHQLDLSGSSYLPRGLGRSYGDSCLNEGGNLISTTGSHSILSWNFEQGLLCCQSGISLEQIISVVLPYGWFLPVTPGTKYVTIGGAIANDVHGKNHHRAGAFGNHLVSFELLRSDGEILLCSPQLNSDYFFATIGGLGLTGVILSATIRLMRVPSSWVDQQTLSFSSLREFFQLSDLSDADFEYSVAWLDGQRIDKEVSGLFFRANHSAIGTLAHKASSSIASRIIDATLIPLPLIQRRTSQFFNHLYQVSNSNKLGKAVMDLDSFFYPLDYLKKWNLLYGRRGFLQYQCVFPKKNDPERALAEVFSILAQKKVFPTLVVLKNFGKLPSLGLMSFPVEGTTIALDFVNTGSELFGVLNHLDCIVADRGGRVYPAKDARMSSDRFHEFYQKLDDFRRYVDPKFSSSFWRRVK